VIGSSFLPGPTATTVPRCSFSFAVSGIIIPPAVFSSALTEPAAPQPITPQSLITTKTNEELIDQFIQNSPRISRSPDDFFDPDIAAKNSAIDKEDIVSETLAQIYYKQGKLDKAIKIYKKLSSAIPEKSSYFAVLIKKIKQEQNLNH
jgi:tetratricopeptide (TPR) repeat protein